MPTVFLVDDDSENLWALRVALESRGHIVMLAGDGQDALQKLTRHLPRLIITDLQMPGMDGVEFCHRVRCQRAFAGIPVILLSAVSEPAVEPPCWTAYFQKPVDPPTLLDTVNVLIAGRMSEVSRRLPFDNPAPSRLQPVDSRVWP